MVHCAYTGHLYPLSYQWTFRLLPDDISLLVQLREQFVFFSFPHPELNSWAHQAFPLSVAANMLFLCRTCDFLTVSTVIDGIQSYIEILNLRSTQFTPNSQPCSLLPSFTDPSWTVSWNSLIYFCETQKIFGGQRKLILES